MGVFYSLEKGFNVMAKHIQSEAQKEYKREQERLMRLVRQGELDGYIFPEDVVPRLPKHVTKQQLEDIKNIRKEDLYEVASFIDKETGEVISNNRKTTTRKPTIKRPRPRTPDTPDRIPTVKSRKSQDKQKLSPEELHRIRVNAGKKAWQTRQAKQGAKYPTKTAIDSVTERVVDMAIKTGELSPEEGEEVLNDLSLDNFPTCDYYEGRLEGIEPHNYAAVYTEGARTRWYDEKSKLLDIWKTTLQNNANDLAGLEEYLISHMSEIDEGIQTAEYGSTLEIMLAGFARFGVILNQGALTAEQAQSLSDESEFLEYDEDSYEEIAELAEMFSQ